MKNELSGFKGTFSVEVFGEVNDNLNEDKINDSLVDLVDSLDEDDCCDNEPTGILFDIDDTIKTKADLIKNAGFSPKKVYVDLDVESNHLAILSKATDRQIIDFMRR